jgi:sugar phosphate isomerase/epimerase
MSELTRREFHQLAIGGMIARLAPYKGVMLGVQSYSFRDRPLDAAIDAMKTVGVSPCELWQGHLEPRDVPREETRRWRETVSLDEFTRTREKFERAGVALSAYNISFKDDFSDREIERGFDMAQALGTKIITASAHVSVVPRVAVVAARRKIPVAMHNHSDPNPNEFASPESLTRAAEAPGGFIRINLDIGHFTAANHDAVAFLRTHHARILSLHLKDRRRNQGENMPFGHGDSPIGPVVRLLRDEQWNIPAHIEYEYKGKDTIDEVKRCLEYCRRQLDS